MVSALVLLPSSSSAFPAVSLGFTILDEIFAYVTVLFCFVLFCFFIQPLK